MVYECLIVKMDIIFDVREAKLQEWKVLKSLDKNVEQNLIIYVVQTSKNVPHSNVDTKTQKT